MFVLCYICTNYASLAQLVEQLIRNEQVVGSSPMRGSLSLTIQINCLIFLPIVSISVSSNLSLKFFFLKKFVTELKKLLLHR
jgi:hypothetical protein